MNNPIICAIDTSNVSGALSLCKDIKDYVGAVKLGLEFFCKNGPDGVKKVAESGLPVFLDLKLHDIPNTVENSLKSLSSLPCFMTTIHMLNGREAIKRCVNYKKENSDKTPMIFGVTILTSHDNIKEIGIDREIEKQVLLLAEIAAKEGLDGIVCSPHEIEPIKARFGNDLKLLCPGIRPNGNQANDQKRVMTPKQAVSLGADYIVIGRPITQSQNPKEAAKEISESLK